jgi:hypothetical protein
MPIVLVLYPHAGREVITAKRGKREKGRFKNKKKKKKKKRRKTLAKARFDLQL